MFDCQNKTKNAKNKLVVQDSILTAWNTIITYHFMLDFLKNCIQHYFTLSKKETVNR